MASAEQYTDPYLLALTQVPVAGPGVCRVCYSGTGTGYSSCNSCYVTMGQVSHPTTKVVPISLYTLSSQYWNILRYYKDGSQTQRATFGIVLAATIARFTALHWACMSRMLGGEPDAVTIVPSTRGRSGGHPLAAVVKRVSRLRSLYEPTLVRGPGGIAHRKASDDCFIVTADVNGRRILVIEDTFTTGARTQSAGSALQLAGAASVGVVTAGRVINPDWNENCQQIWQAARASPFTFEVCVLCAHRHR